MERLFRSAPRCAFALFFTVILFSACKNTPVPQALPEIPPELSPTLVFEGIEAEGPEHLTLFFTLGIENPLPFAGRAKVGSWRVEINGRPAHSGFSLSGAEDSFPIEAEASSLFSLVLNMDVAALAAEGLAPSDDYDVNLILELDFSAGTAGSADSFPSLQVSGLAAFPGVRAPGFSITALAILKAELINTRFRVTMRIDNPNPFPVDLSAFGYELYGNGRSWADGTERNLIKIPAKSSVQGNLFLAMNFINMKRDLLEQIIRLQDVNYRFAGEVQVSTGVEYLPRFVTGFDLSGYSQVLEN